MTNTATSIFNVKGDKVIWAIFVILAMFSLLAVYSATGSIAWKERGGDTEYFLIKQALLIGGGFVVAYLFHWMHYLKFSKAAPVLVVLAPLLLLFTLAYGVNINDARRWLEIPFTGMTFQTSDFAKIALVVYIARVISSKQDIIKDFNQAFLPIIVPIVIVCGCIAPADLSTAILLFTVCFLMMFIGRVDWKFLALLVMCGLVAFAFLIVIDMVFPNSNFVRVDTWTQRIQDFMFNSEGGYQIQQAKIAIADGGLIGQGPGHSIQRNYLPSPYSDFIYAIICEEYGLVGGLAVIGLYVTFFLRVVKMVTRSPKAFGSMLAIGLGMIIVIQAFLNIAVAVHLLPVTGLTLPLVSMGGTSLLFTCMSIGMILSVSRYVDKPRTANG
ncbi:MAG: FtsW/RodA/SpoVE family cell cycle protein [Bacteroidia bacterium]|nr:FtsW/RodA/SpoVE family cell cycle protein [Bacteroidia bacterium]